MSAAIHAAAHDMCVKGYRDEIAAAGVLEPCPVMDPLDPPLRPDEYSMMERFACLFDFIRLIPPSPDDL